jgi:iron complex outermembrane receptor protein
MRDVLSGTATVGADRATLLRGGTLALLAGAACALFNPVARAQDAAATAPASASEGQLEDVVVTARKRSESLHDIPASVQAIPDTLIRDAHMTRLDDLSSIVSNLNIFEAHDNSPAVTMRGVGTFEVVQGVGFYMNDVQLFEGQTVRPNDVARIEVLKGPQGTLYGGANIGGAIKYVTKDPSTTWENEATVELGQYKTRSVEAIFSGPIAQNLGIRGSFYDENHGGYITDTTYNKVIGDSHDRGGRIVLLAEPDHVTNVRLSFNYDNLDSQNQNLQYLDPTHNFFGTTYQPYTADNYTYNVLDYFNPSFKRKLYSTTLEADHQFDNGTTITSITSQFWSYNRGVTDLTKQAVPIDLLFQNIDNRVVSEELRLSSGAHASLDWLAGAFVMQHKTITQNGDWLFNPNGPPFPDGAASYYGYDSDLQQKTQKQFALFGDATWYAGDLSYELGLRVESYSSRLEALNQPAPAPACAVTSTCGAPWITAEPTAISMPAQSVSHTAVSPRLSIQYRLNAQVNLYGTYAKGFTPGDLVEQPVTNGQVTPSIGAVRPEVANSFELGVKSRFANGASINAAAYYMKYKDRLYQSMIASAGGFFDITTNIGDSRNSGLEVDFQLPVTKEWKLSGGLGTTRAVWGNALYNDPQASGIATALAGGPPPNITVTTNIQGMKAPFTPSYTANLALDWNEALANGWKVGARVDGSAIGESYWDPNDYARQKPYHLVNLGARLDTGNMSWLAHVSNLTGTRFNTMAWDAWDVNVPRSFARINRPRTATLSATYRF